MYDPIPTSINAFLINTGSKRILIDAGTGHFLGDHLGQLLANLQSAGNRPDEVDEIYLTHMDPDHIGGLVTNHKAAFPQAIVRVSQPEADFWLTRSPSESADLEKRLRFQQGRDAIAPYEQTGRLRLFKDDATLEPGICAVGSAGHSPGHTSYVVESAGTKLVVLGDILHVGFVQFANPKVGLKFDADGVAAAAQREKALANAADDRYWVAGAHLPCSGIGHIRVHRRGYRWLLAGFDALH